MTRLFFRLLFCSELAYVRLTSGEQVKYKSIEVLTFHSRSLVPIWSDVLHLCTPPFSLLSSFVFIVLGKFTCKFPHNESRINVMCFTNNLLQINHCNHHALVFIIYCINLAYGHNHSVSTANRLRLQAVFSSNAVQERGWVPAVFFHLNSYQLHQWNCLVWTCALLTDAPPQGTNGRTRRRLFRIQGWCSKLAGPLSRSLCNTREMTP